MNVSQIKYRTTINRVAPFFRLGALASQCSPLIGHQAQPAAHPFPHHVPKAPRKQVDPTHRGDVETETIHFPKCISHKGRWNTETIHFTQVNHHPKLNDGPTHDAPEGSRTPGNNTGEERPKKEWSILVTFSVTPVPTEHSSDLASPYCGQTVHCRRSRVDRSVTQSLAIPCIPTGIHLSEPTVLSTVTLATHDEF